MEAHISEQKVEEYKQFLKLIAEEVNVHKIWNYYQGQKDGRWWNIVFNRDTDRFELEDPELWAFAKK